MGKTKIYISKMADVAPIVIDHIPNTGLVSICSISSTICDQVCPT